ncbi:MAG: sigma 54-dependent Fis family transcriptional regulator [Myxococcaceae bacterium]
MDSPNIPTDAMTPAELAPLALKVVVVSGPDFKKELLLDAGSYRVGKDPACELALTDSAVSRTHLVIEVTAAGAKLSDQGSTNGSFIDGVQFSSVVARPPSRIKLGRTELQLLPRGERVTGPAPSDKERFGELIGSSLEMRRVFAVLERLAPAGGDVLIQGETGCGKELCARAIHAHSARAKGPFVICDLAAVAPTLAAAELFGHAKGAYTGALKDRAGLVEKAHGGTLFLDELGDFSLELQPSLLRVLERREVRRVGENDYRPVDIRVVAATHKDLPSEVKAGRFREDLYYRIAANTVTLPPLRDRREDIPQLVDELLAKLGKPKSQLSPETRTLLLAQAWPGNVRELRNVVERAVGLGDVGEEAKGPLSFKDAKDKLLAAFERDYLKDLMRRCNDNVSRAAREAGIDRVHLHRLLKKHAVE